MLIGYPLLRDAPQAQQQDQQSTCQPVSELHTGAKYVSASLLHPGSTVERVIRAASARLNVFYRLSTLYLTVGPMTDITAAQFPSSAVA
jgi:hypothetical protein